MSIRSTVKSNFLRTRINSLSENNQENASATIPDERTQSLRKRLGSNRVSFRNQVSHETNISDTYTESEEKTLPSTPLRNPRSESRLSESLSESSDFLGEISRIGSRRLRKSDRVIKDYVERNQTAFKLFIALSTITLIPTIVINATSFLTKSPEYGQIFSSMLLAVKLVTQMSGLTTGIFFLNWVYTELSTEDLVSTSGATPDKDWEEYINLIRKETIESNLRSRLYSKLPLRMISRLFGFINSTKLPKFVQIPMMKIFIKVYGLNMEEAENPIVRQYSRMNTLFTRPLKDNARPMDKLSNLVSPVDGKVLSFGCLDEGTERIEQVKGSDYSLKALLGRPKNLKTSLSEISEKEYRKCYLKNPENELYYIVIYLAPGDYHRFHSPADIVFNSRRHFPGDLYSVNPKVASWLKNLFVLNERVALFGEWEYGFFSYTAVGATMVGSIEIYFDDDVATSKAYRKSKADKHKGYYFDRVFEEEKTLKKGDQIGEFNLGSTVILTFEAEKGFEFDVEVGEKLRIGKSIRKVAGMKVEVCQED